LRELAGYVGQSPFVFAATIKENIAYEQKDATEEEIQNAARLACLDDDIQQMPEGYNTLVAEAGHNLSGGQKQRLALARMFLKNPPLLILDEATSALDSISEQHIQQSLAADRGDRTVILVAHRLSTLLHTDRIIVFDQGRIAEVGPYHELVDRGGVFADLVRSTEASVATLKVVRLLANVTRFGSDQGNPQPLLGLLTINLVAKEPGRSRKYQPRIEWHMMCMQCGHSRLGKLLLVIERMSDVHCDYPRQ